MRKQNRGFTLSGSYFLTIWFLICAWSEGHAQIEYSFYVNPFVQRYGNLDKISTEYTTPNFDVHYSKIPSQHVGFEMTFPSSKKISFVAGIQHVSNHYRMDYRFYAPNTNQKLTVAKGIEELNTQSAGFKLGIKSQVRSWLAIQASVGVLITYNPKDENLTSKSGSPYGYYIDPNGNPTQSGYNFIYKYHITKGGLYPQLCIPELSLHFRVVNNLYLRLGTQLKFFEWDKSSGYLDVTVDGKDYYFDQVSPDEQLHFSRVKRTEFNYYLGLSYSIMGKGRASKRRLE